MSEPGDASQGPRRSRACRNLFGPVDAEQLRRDCAALMAGCLQEARERWNFDFVTETPLEGSFAWERVWGLGPPPLHRSRGPARPRPHDPAGLPPSLAQGPQQPEESPRGPGAPQGRKRRQTSMTDFYHSKRRLVFSKRKP